MTPPPSRPRGLRSTLVLSLALAALLLAGCQSIEMGSSKALSDVMYDHVVALQAFERKVAITSAGDVTVEQVTGPESKDRRVATAKLTPDQRTELLDVFRGWNSLKPNYAVTFDQVITVQYGDYSVTAGGDPRTPKSFMKACEVLNKIADAALAAAATQPAPARP